MTPTDPRRLAHLELHTADLAGARTFYSELLGWRPELIEAAERSYLALDLGEGPSGGIVECGTERALWLPYVSVPEVNSATEQAEELGGSVLLEPREGPAGWRSVVRAPDGGEIAFWQSKSWGPPRSREGYEASSAKR
jgi:predicted enzyme related to lactoylglutathione lyase